MPPEEVHKLKIAFRRPPYWDPIPPWRKLPEADVARFNKLQQELNQKISEIETQKVLELEKIAGVTLE